MKDGLLFCNLKEVKYIMDENQNMSVITEQGDLGLGTRQLTDEEQKLVNEQQEQQRQQRKGK